MKITSSRRLFSLFVVKGYSLALLVLPSFKAVPGRFGLEKAGSLEGCLAQGRGCEGYQRVSSASFTLQPLDHLRSFFWDSEQARGIACKCHCHSPCLHTLPLPAAASSHRLSMLGAASQFASRSRVSLPQPRDPDFQSSSPPVFTGSCVSLPLTLVNR